jgi:hypothetical protein
MRWDHSCLPLYLYVGSPPSALSRDQIIGMTREAARAWSQDALACSGLRLDVVPRDGIEGPIDHERINRVMFRRKFWGRDPRDPTSEYDRSALAITSVFATTDDGTIVDADIEVNAVHFTWGDVASGRAGPRMQDLQNVLTHEIGHLIGLDHTCRSGEEEVLDHRNEPVPKCQADSLPSAVREATMFASAEALDTQKRSLSEDDIAAVCDIYPASGKLSCEAPDDDLGCAFGTGRPAGPLGVAVALSALAVVTGLARRRRR